MLAAATAQHASCSDEPTLDTTPAAAGKPSNSGHRTVAGAWYRSAECNGKSPTCARAKTTVGDMATQCHHADNSSRTSSSSDTTPGLAASNFNTCLDNASLLLPALRNFFSTAVSFVRACTKHVSRRVPTQRSPRRQPTTCTNLRCCHALRFDDPC